MLSNIMLNELDYELDNRHLNFVRYADDVVIVLKNKAAATRVIHNRLDREKAWTKGKCYQNKGDTAEKTEISRIWLLERQRRIEGKTSRKFCRTA